jgi:hypothetical protein
MKKPSHRQFPLRGLSTQNFHHSEAFWSEPLFREEFLAPHPLLSDPPVFTFHNA